MKNVARSLAGLSTGREIANVSHNEFDLSLMAFEILAPAADEVVERANRGAALDEHVDQVRTDEPRGPRDEDLLAPNVRYRQGLLSLFLSSRPERYALTTLGVGCR